MFLTSCEENGSQRTHNCQGEPRNYKLSRVGALTSAVCTTGPVLCLGWLLYGTPSLFFLLLSVILAAVLNMAVAQWLLWFHAIMGLSFLTH